MERRNAKVTFSKSVNNSLGCKLSIPKDWTDRMGIDPEDRNITLYFDGDNITVRRQEMSPIKHTPLASKQKILRFALIWQQMYLNHKTIPFFFFEDVMFLGDELADLGFEMDCGNSLEEAFPGVDAYNDNAEFEKILEKIDLQTLGNAIFSQWRYWNHWSMGPMEEKDFQWFVKAFSRLAELASYT